VLQCVSSGAFWSVFSHLPGFHFFLVVSLFFFFGMWSLCIASFRGWLLLLCA